MKPIHKIKSKGQLGEERNGLSKHRESWVGRCAQFSHYHLPSPGSGVYYPRASAPPLLIGGCHVSVPLCWFKNKK